MMRNVTTVFCKYSTMTTKPGDCVMGQLERRVEERLMGQLDRRVEAISGEFNP
jgi:hypothetical protein